MSCIVRSREDETAEAGCSMRYHPCRKDDPVSRVCVKVRYVSFHIYKSSGCWHRDREVYQLRNQDHCLFLTHSMEAEGMAVFSGLSRIFSKAETSKRPNNIIFLKTPWMGPGERGHWGHILDRFLNPLLQFWKFVNWEKYLLITVQFQCPGWFTGNRNLEEPEDRETAQRRQTAPPRRPTTAADNEGEASKTSAIAR